MDTQTTIRIHPVDRRAVEDARRTGRDVNGSAVEKVSATGGEPVRCCLSDARAGERLLLLGYRPDLPPSPYTESGAVFVHEEPCSGPVSTSDYPTDWLTRPQVLRAYDRNGWIHPATRAHDGTRSVAELADVLHEPGVVEVHSRNVAYGCFMFAATLARGEDAGHGSDAAHDRSRPESARLP